jgi:hypothetical protein
MPKCRMRVKARGRMCSRKRRRNSSVRVHITLYYVAAFVLFAAIRSVITGHVFLAEVAPITGPMYQLFIFFMITDPKTTVKPRWAQCVVAVLVAAMEMILRLAENIHAPYYALTIVGPVAVAIEIWYASRTRPRVSEVVAAA